MSTIQDTDLLLVNRGGKDYKVKAEDLYVYSNPPVVIFHIINLQNVTGSLDPLFARVWEGILENLTTGDREEVDERTSFELIEGNDYLITVPDDDTIEFLPNDAYTWDFGPKCDTKRMISIASMCLKNTEFDGDLSNLDVSNVTTMYNAFSHTNKCTLKGVEKWDVSNVEKLWNFFSHSTGLTDLTVLKDWDVSSCKDYTSTFNGCTSILSAKALEGWNTKSAFDMGYMFQGCTGMTEISDFSQWCTPVINRTSSFNSLCEDKVIEPIWGTCPRGEDKP